jgi:uncharacterized protein (TIGR03083 family)
MSLDTTTYLASIRRDSDALVAAAQGNLAGRVPTCPDWNVGDLLWHVAGVFNFWGQIVEGRLLDQAGVVGLSDPEDDEELLPLLRDRTDHLLGVLEAADLDTPIWTWSSVKRVAFVPRRMAQEVAVHRFDGQTAAGAAQPLDAAIAADGVDEFFEHMLSDDEEMQGRPETVALEATDTGIRWLVNVGDGTKQVARAVGDGPPPAATVRATTSELDLALWRRVGPDALDVTGDRGAVGRLVARTQLD